MDRSPAEFDADIALERMIAGWRPPHIISADRLRRHLDAKRRQDFAEENVVAVAGWILARSEADAIGVAYALRMI